MPDVFLSYCWSNSLSAAKKSGRIHSESLGWGDPRKLKDILENNGISCWIDTEYVGKEKVGFILYYFAYQFIYLYADCMIVSYLLNNLSIFETMYFKMTIII